MSPQGKCGGDFGEIEKCHDSAVEGEAQCLGWGEGDGRFLGGYYDDDGAGWKPATRGNTGRHGATRGDMGRHGATEDDGGRCEGRRSF